MFDEIMRNSIYLQFIDIVDVDKPDFALYMVMEHDPASAYNDFFVTFAVNESNVSLAMPMCGVYPVKISGCSTLLFPVHPKFAITLIHRKEFSKFFDGSNIRLLRFTQDTAIRTLNLIAFKEQQKQHYRDLIKYSWLVSNNRSTLEYVLDDLQTKAVHQ